MKIGRYIRSPLLYLSFATSDAGSAAPVSLQGESQTSCHILVASTPGKVFFRKDFQVATAPKRAVLNDFGTMLVIVSGANPWHDTFGVLGKNAIPRRTFCRERNCST